MMSHQFGTLKMSPSTKSDRFNGEERRRILNFNKRIPQVGHASKDLHNGSVSKKKYENEKIETEDYTNKFSTKDELKIWKLAKNEIWIKIYLPNPSKKVTRKDQYHFSRGNIQPCLGSWFMIFVQTMKKGTLSESTFSQRLFFPTFVMDLRFPKGWSNWKSPSSRRGRGISQMNLSLGFSSQKWRTSATLYREPLSPRKEVFFHLQALPLTNFLGKWVKFWASTEQN